VRKKRLERFTAFCQLNYLQIHEEQESKPVSQPLHGVTLIYAVTFVFLFKAGKNEQSFGFISSEVSLLYAALLFSKISNSKIYYTTFLKACQAFFAINCNYFLNFSTMSSNSEGVAV
jgi:hypothetical protein